MGVECLGDYNPPKLKYSLGKEKKEREKKEGFKSVLIFWPTKRKQKTVQTRRQKNCGAVQHGNKDQI